MKKFIKKIIRLSIFGAMIYGGYLANQEWEEFKPVLAELEEKDPEKYKKMGEEAKAFHVKETMKLYKELDEMTFEEVLDLRYRKFLEKRKADKKFREKSYDDELLTREEERKVKLEEDQSKIQELKNLQTIKPVKLRFGKWEKIKPWQQRLILREKCIKYFKKEKEERLFQEDGLKTSKLTTLVSRAGKEPLEVEYLCEDLVSKGTTPQEIRNSIFRLKDTMNFYYFAQLLEETGIPRGVVFPFNEELKGLSRYYNDS